VSFVPMIEYVVNASLQQKIHWRRNDNFMLQRLFGI